MDIFKLFEWGSLCWLEENVIWYPLQNRKTINRMFFFFLHIETPSSTDTYLIFLLSNQDPTIFSLSLYIEPNIVWTSEFSRLTRLHCDGGPEENKTPTRWVNLFIYMYIQVTCGIKSYILWNRTNNKLWSVQMFRFLKHHPQSLFFNGCFVKKRTIFKHR